MFPFLVNPTMGKTPYSITQKQRAQLRKLKRKEKEAEKAN